MKEKYSHIVDKVMQLMQRNTLGNRAPNVSKSWHLALAFTLCVILALCGIGVYVFFFSKIQTNTINTEIAYEHTTFNKEILNQTIVLYRERVNHFIELENGSVVAPDLGLPEYSEITETEEMKDIPLE